MPNSNINQNQQINLINLSLFTQILNFVKRIISFMRILVTSHFSKMNSAIFNEIRDLLIFLMHIAIKVALIIYL